MARLDALEREKQESLAEMVKTANEAAFKKLEPELNAAKKAQDELEHYQGKLIDVRDHAKQDGTNLWTALQRVASKGIKENVKAFVIASLIETHLGRIDEKPQNVQSTIRQYRTIIGQELALARDEALFKAARAYAGVADGVADTSIGYTSMRKMVTFSGKVEGQVQFEEALRDFSRAVKTAGKNQAANEKEGIVELERVPYSDLTAFLKSVTAKIPQRTVVGAQLEADTETEGEDMTIAAQDVQAIRAADIEPAQRKQA